MQRPASKNGKDRTLAESGKCGFCHAIHDAKGPALWTATSEPPDSAEALCTTCHASGNPYEARVVGRILHPQVSLACTMCHDPHANVRQTTALLWNIYANDSESLCMDCHVDTESMEMSFHSKDSLQGYAGADTTCGPCHVVHAPSKDWPGDMWAGPVGNVSDPPGIQHCTGCHSSSGGWSDVAFLEHPALPMANVQPPGTAGFMPLVDSLGNLNAAGQIACVTCHLPHGRAKDGGFIPLDFQTEPLPSIHAAKPMLRPYVAPNLCTSCHGFDGLSKFLYFHKSSRQQVRVTSKVPFRD